MLIYLEIGNLLFWVWFWGLGLLGLGYWFLGVCVDWLGLGLGLVDDEVHGLGLAFWGLLGGLLGVD